MAHTSTISSKGQATVPQEIRQRLGLRAGDRVEFVVEENRTVIRPARPQANPFEKFIGALGPFPGGDEGIQTWIDDMRSEEGYERIARRGVSRPRLSRRA